MDTEENIKKAIKLIHEYRDYESDEMENCLLNNDIGELEEDDDNDMIVRSASSQVQNDYVLQKNIREANSLGNRAMKANKSVENNADSIEINDNEDKEYIASPMASPDPKSSLNTNARFKGSFLFNKQKGTIERNRGSLSPPKKAANELSSTNNSSKLKLIKIPSKIYPSCEEIT